jgi:signal transduction histidine kinase
MNPLTAVTLAVSTMDKQGPADLPEIRTYLEKAMKATKRVEGLLSSVQKQLSMRQSVSTFSLNEEIEQAIELLAYKARKAKVEIRFQATEQIDYFGSAISFHHIATNLLSNAIDACEAKNEEKDYVGLITSTVKKESETILFSVSDNGCGIDPAIIEKIFDPFFTTKATHKGMGLGLSATKKSVEKELGGTLTVISTPDKGSTFTVSLPPIYPSHAKQSENNQ